MNDDKMHPIALEDRTSRSALGFMSAANVGWIQLGTETTFQPAHIEYSVHGVAHSEERLIAWAIGQGADLSLAPTAAGEKLRVKGLYTERAPCRLEDNRNGGDQARYDRVATNRCCHDYLTAVLHDDVEVIHSVDNAPAPHELLRNGEWVKFHKNKELRRVARAYNPKRAIVGPVPAFIALFVGHRATIIALQPTSLSRFHVDNHLRAVLQAATAAVTAIQAWQPPVAVVAPLGPAPGPPGPPPGPPGPAPGPPGPAPGPPGPAPAPAPAPPGPAPTPPAPAPGPPGPAPAPAPGSKRALPTAPDAPAPVVKRPLVGSGTS